MPTPLEILNERVAEFVKASWSFCVYRYPNPADGMLLPKGAKPLWIGTKNGIQCLWALVDPKASPEPTPISVKKLTWTDFPTTEDAVLPVPIVDDIEIELPEKHRLLYGAIVPSSNRFMLALKGDLRAPRAKFMFRLSATGHPIGSFESKLFKFACPVISPNMGLVQHLFYVTDEALPS